MVKIILVELCWLILELNPYILYEIELSFNKN